MHVTLEVDSNDITNSGERNIEETTSPRLETSEQRMKEDGLCKEDIGIRRMMQDELLSPEPGDPLNLRFYDRKKSRQVTAQVNLAVPYLNANSLFECNQILKAAGRVVARILGVKKRAQRKKSDPFWWKRRKSQERSRQIEQHI